MRSAEELPEGFELHALWACHRAEEGRLVRRALVGADWNVSAAARALNCSKFTLFRVLERHPEVDQERRRRLEAA